MDEANESGYQAPIQESTLPKDDIQRIAEAVGRAFSEYSDMDANADSTRTADDIRMNGRFLYFYTSEGRLPENPRLQFIFLPQDYVLNYYNSPAPQNPNLTRNANDSVRASGDRRWRVKEVDLALEVARIHMDGVDLGDEGFKSQLFGWSERLGRFVTMQEAIEDHSAARAKRKSGKLVSVPESALSSEKAAELASTRLGRQATETEVAAEINKIWALYSLLWPKNILPKITTPKS